MVVASLPDEGWVRDVGPLPGVDLVVWDVESPHHRLGDIELVVPPYLGGAARLANLRRLPRLGVVQLLTAGYEDAVAHLPDGVLLCNAAGVHDASTAELAVALTLASLRGIPDFVAAQGDSRWLPTRIWPALADRRVLIVGYGRIGRAVAARLAPFEVSLTAVASRAREGDGLVAAVHGIRELGRLLPDHDVVVLVVPLTAGTAGLVDHRFLAAMPDGALLVNVSRGRVVDTDALVAAASTGRVRAALDVTDPEPLPPDHPLWDCPGVLISPHVGGASSAFRPRAARLVRDQLGRYAVGAPLANLVRGDGRDAASVAGCRSRGPDSGA